MKDILTTEQKLEEIKYEIYKYCVVDDLELKMAFIEQVKDEREKEKYVNELYETFCE